MLMALLADIHANREALEACLEDARNHDAERLVFLGDHVGYGADPEWVAETIREEVAAGGIALLGNHDAAVGGRDETMDSPAQTASDWTRVQLGAAPRAFLAGLPLTVETNGCLFVHSEAAAPKRWTYVMDSYDALRSLTATRCRLTFCGHVHRPAIYNLSATKKLTAFRPVTGVAVPLLPQRRWLCVLGSVGQPRDGNPAASYAMLDTDKSEITYLRVPYDIETAAAKILDAGLPESLAERLRFGI